MALLHRLVGWKAAAQKKVGMSEGKLCVPVFD